MVRSDESNPGVIEPTNAQGDLRAGGGKISSGVGQNRTALSNIDPNKIGGPPYPSEVNKRGPPEKNGISDKDLPILVHRPVTRKFAAQMANNRRVIAETSSSMSRSEDRSITDVEDYHAGVEDPMPMFVQHTQALLDEIDHQMVEVEMEDIADEELVVDIDSSDKDNQLAVVEYIDDLYAYYRKSESSSCVPPNYMANQFDINERTRGILIDWLIEVHYKFERMEETLYLTVNLVDRF